MTLLPMTMPQLESRPTAGADRPTVTKSAEESSARFFKEALQRAGTRDAHESRQARKSAARTEDSSHAPTRKASQPDEPERAAATAPSRDSEEERTVSDSSASQDTTPVEARESQEASSGVETAENADAETDEALFAQKSALETAGNGGKPRAGRKKGEDPWMALPAGGVLLAHAMTGHALLTQAEDGGEMATGLARVPSFAQPGQVPGQIPGQAPPDGQLPTGAPEQTPFQQIAVTASPAQRLAETMGSKGMARSEVALPPALSASDDKNDFAFAMRLVSDGARGAGGKPTVTAQTPLSANSPTFADDMADEVGRLRVIARPGGVEQVRITLNPRDLGGMDMRLVVDEDHQVHLMITTETEATRDLINRQMPQLREALARQNLEMGDVMVHVDDGRGGEGMPEWGFQGGNPTEDQATRESLFWRGARGVESAEVSVEGVPTAAPATGGGSGLSLFA
ncbi:MAG: flagellar hook-length control protein FliK [Magnetococcales bacterium]|nr:flagellar hook-length control protein FliK [Magnetococcales bacterium]